MMNLAVGLFVYQSADQHMKSGDNNGGVKCSTQITRILLVLTSDNGNQFLKPSIIQIMIP